MFLRRKTKEQRRESKLEQSNVALILSSARRKDVANAGVKILLIAIIMETTTIISRSTDYKQRHGVKTQSNSSVHHLEGRAKHDTPTAVIPFLVLAYIFNGSHDPKQVFRLSIVLSVAFFIVGLILRPEFLFVGTMFFAIALSNVGCVWIVRSFGRNLSGPVVGEIRSQLHISMRLYTKR